MYRLPYTLCYVIMIHPHEIFVKMSLESTWNVFPNFLSYCTMKTFDFIWDLLGKKLVIAFGRECASASIWMFEILIIRSILSLLSISRFIPYGLIFALPSAIKVSTCYSLCEFRMYFDLFPICLIDH